MQKFLNLKKENNHNDNSSQERDEKFTQSQDIPQIPTEIETVKELKYPSPKRRTLTNIMLVIFFLLILTGAAAIYFVIIPLQHITASANNIQAEAFDLAKDFESKDVSNLSTRFHNIQNEINNIDSEIDKYDFLATTDLTKGYYNNFKIAKRILRKSSDLLDTILPDLKDILKASGFKTESGDIIEVNSDSEDKGPFNLVLQKMPEYLALYKNIEPDILDILNDLKEIDPTYLPNIGDYDFKSKLETINASAEEFPVLSTKIQDFLAQLPKLLGSNQIANYLLILQNETEMRSSGGLLTAIGHMSFDKGQFGEDIFLTDIEKMENYLTYTLGISSLKYGYHNIYGQLTLMNLNCGAYHLRAQDSGIYPDLALTMEMLGNYYKEAGKYDSKTYPTYDYELILNLAFSQKLIGLIQPLDVEGYGEVTAENLFEFIKAESDSENSGTARKDIIKDIANAAKEKFLNLPVEKLPEAITIIIQAFQAHDLGLLAPNDKDLQAYFDKYGMSGRVVKDFEGDYFQFSEAQNCSLKLNKFIRDSIEQNVIINSDGSINRDLKVTWIQPKVFEPGLEKQYSPFYNFSYRAWIRVFAPVGVPSFTSDGYKQSGYVGYTPVSYYDDKMDKQVSDNIIQFDHRRFKEEDPIFRKDLSISYKLPASINYIDDGGYKLLIQKHPGKSWGEPYKFNIQDNGETYTVDFILDRDKILSYKDGIISVENYDTSLDWIPELVAKIPLDKISQ